MVTAEQLKELLNRLNALRGYLELDKKAIEIQEEEEKTQAPEKRQRRARQWREPCGSDGFLRGPGWQIEQRHGTTTAIIPVARCRGASPTTNARN